MKKTVLITGVSGGIGKELADLFARDSHNLVLVARNEAKLQEMAKEYKQKYGTHSIIIAKDVSATGMPQAVFAELQEKGIVVDYLINNAGFGLYGTFLETDLEQEVNMIDINIKALTVMTKLFLPDMVKRGHGGIMNVSSLVGFFPGPLMSVYYASKAYVLSFTEALENELRGTDVTVTALCPGVTATGFFNRSGMEEAPQMAKSGSVMTSSQVAKEGYHGFLKGDTLIIPGARNRLLAFMPRLLPRKWTTRLVRSTQANTNH